MKVIAVIVLFCVEVYSVPMEASINHPKEPKWVLVPDTDWTLHLVDVNEQTEPEVIFNPQQDVMFKLFTNTDSNRLVELDNEASLTGCSFNPTNPTRFIIHGWQGDENSSVNIDIRTAYLAKGNFNVFIVDWSRLASYNYISASRMVESVGKTIAKFIIFLNRQTGMTLGSVTLVGHSLGGHVAGFVGKNVKERGRIGVLVGLDVAYPFYAAAKPHEMLHISDAAYVESIHTNTGLLGQIYPIGHASFYPNYGNYQPGCGTDFFGACSHARSHEYYAESITTNRGFWAQKCKNHEEIIKRTCQVIENDALMGGEPSIKKLKGIFLLHTNSSSPYAAGKVEVILKS